MISQIPFPSSFSSNPCVTLSHSSPFPLHISSFPFNSPSRRRRPFKLPASSLLPLLPFPIEQVLVPSEIKILHLYEARYIALLEEALFRKNNLLVHFVLDQAGFASTSVETPIFAKYGCLVVLEKVQQLEIGALVSIRGVGRVEVSHIEQALPYLTGEVIPLQDNAFTKMAEVNTKVLELKDALQILNSLEIRLKVPGELLQTRTKNSLAWAEKPQSLDCITDFIPSVAERVSFAAFQPASGATRTEILELQRKKLIAMDTMDTLERLKKSLELTKSNISVVAAKLAIQNLGMR